MAGLAGALMLLLPLTACTEPGDNPSQPSTSSAQITTGASRVASATDAAMTTDAGPATAATTAQAIFAGGCFWCMEPPFDNLPGVVSTTSGYIGGHTHNPTYGQVSNGSTGHAEAVRVVYDPRQVSYDKLLQVFWHNIDPVAVDRQFCDIGNQYRSAIFPADASQRSAAQISKRRLQAEGRFDQPIATTIEAATTFYPAEDYHQDYYEKNPVRYKYYRYSCGRDQRLHQIWGDPD